MIQINQFKSSNYKPTFGDSFRLIIPKDKAKIVFDDLTKFSNQHSIPIKKLAENEINLDEKSINILFASENKSFLDIFVKEKSVAKPSKFRIIKSSGDLYNFFDKNIKPLFLVSS